MRRLRWTEQAVEDLSAIRDYIHRDSPRYAQLVIENLIDHAEKAADFPNAGRVVPELGREDLREVIVGSYRIVYRVTEIAVTILTIFRSSRLFPLSDIESPA
ncbi:MAG: type II toxin-antitoxin system RelE/ParE family toxin [Gemmatimonadota bacterium]